MIGSVVTCSSILEITSKRKEGKIKKGKIKKGKGLL